ncbi:hypothetical protein, partial [Aquidulcibacter sp.]|uniref:hypothetical protein n=1 Tax=Aquidulcibacter sp. TaxID=2052990 RepID=UPI0025BE4DA1
TPSSLARALAVPSVTIGQRVVSGGSGGQYPELTFLIPDTASQGSGVVQLQGPATGNTTPLLAAAQIRNIGLSRGLLHGEPVVPGWYRWRAAGRDVDGSVGAFDTTWQAAVQVTAPLVAGEAGAGIGGAPILNSQVPLGENQVVNSDLNQGLNGFEFVFASGTNLTGPGLSTNGGRNLVGSVPPVNYFGGRNVFWSTASVSSGNFTGGTYLESFRQLGISGPTASNLRRYATQVIPGERIYYSAKIAVHGMTTAVAQVNFYDRDGAYLSTASTSSVIGDGRVAGPNAHWGLPANFATVGGPATVPANAVFAAMSTSGNTLNGAQPSVLVFSCDYFIAKVGADQTVAPAYNPGPVDRAADRTGENTAGGFVGQGNQSTINRYRQSTAPSSPNEGDIWEDTSTTPVSYRKRMSGAWVFQSEEGADITAQAVPSLEGPASVSFDVDGAGALSLGSQVPRTLQFVRKRGNTDVSTSTTWSIVSPVNVTLGTITNGGVNITAVAAGLSNFTVRSVRDGVTIDLVVAVVKNTIAAGVTSATRKTVTTANGTPNNGNWTDIASVVISNCPTGNLYFDSSFSFVSTGTGNCSHQARLTVDGVQVGSIQATQPTVTGGVPEAVDFSTLFAQVIPVTAGSRTIAFQLQRTTGTGQITASNTRFDVAAFPG